jgi:hypothetical protein
MISIRVHRGSLLVEFERYLSRTQEAPKGYDKQEIEWILSFGFF